MSKAPRTTKTIEHDPAEKPKAHPTQGAVPAVEEKDNPETALADVAENHPGYVYKPQQGVVSTDVLEIALAFCLQIFAPHIDISPGALRVQALQGERWAKLSPDAQRHMRPLPPQQPPVAPEPPVA